MTHLRSLLEIAFCLAVVACSAPSSSDATVRAAGTDPRFDTDYVLVILKTGPRINELSVDERKTIQAGHMANILRLADEEKLFIAGPFGEPRHDPTWRGIFVFDVRTVDEARALADTDPGAKAGLFAMEVIPFRGASWLPALLDLEDEDKEHAKQEGRELTMAEQIRSYAMLTTSDAAEAERVLAPLFASRQVVVAGRLGGEHAGGGLYVMDFKDPDAAKEGIGAGMAQLGSAAIDAWWATSNLVELEQTKAAH